MSKIKNTIIQDNKIIEAKLKELEHNQDVMTLRFWESIISKDQAIKNYNIAERNMRFAKAAYLKFKLEGVLI